MRSSRVEPRLIELGHRKASFTLDVYLHLTDRTPPVPLDFDLDCVVAAMPA